MNENPPPTKHCPKCGTALSADAVEGLCPACLLSMNLATQTNPGTEADPATGPAQAPAPSPETVAKHFPQYEILECLGRGGMGVVYKARQKSLERLVALKILAPEREKDPQFAERFAREAKTLAQLNHPNIVTVHDFGETGGMFYLVMEFVDGVSLHQLLGAGRLAPKEALAIVPAICEALQFAHDRGIVHRDIKPGNVLLDRQGRVKIADFGIARIMGAAEETAGAAQAGGGARPGLTGARTLGTPAYMAPEQAANPTEVDHRADIYALGVVFYQMLTGELPGKPLQPPSKKVQVDVRLDEVVLRALEKKPELRYQQVSEVKTMVETIVGSASVPPAEPVRKNSTGKSIAIGCGVLAAGLVFLWLLAMAGVFAGLFSSRTQVAPTFGPVIEREVNRPVSDFPETTDLSTPESATPESACAAWQRATARKDAQAVSRLSWVKIDPAEEEAWFRNEEARDREGLAIYLKALAESKIMVVQTWRGDLANVITFLPFPSGKGRQPYSARSFGRIGGQWKNLGEDRLPSLEAARVNFAQKKEVIWEQLQSLQAGPAAAKQPFFPPVIEREVNRPVSDFPETTDLSTPESACAAWQRATARKDAQAVSRLSWGKIDLAEEEAWFRNEEARDREGLAIYLKALTESRIVEVRTWRDDLADVITFLPFPPGKGRHPYSARSFGRIGGQWKNLGEDRLPSLEAARANFEQKKAAIWEQLGEFRPETGAPVPMTVRLEKVSQQPTSPADAEAAPRLQFRLVATGDDPSADTLPGRDGKEQFRLERDEAPVASATVTNVGQGATILVTFTKAGAKRFAEISSANIGKRLAIVLDGKVICAPTIRDTVVGGQAQITGKFTAAEAEEIAQALRAMNARQRTGVQASKPALVTTNFYIGQSAFPHGDSIEITSVSRTQEKMVVKGHYNLISADRAQLALFITSTNWSSLTYIDQRQWTEIAKGRGDFELFHPHLYPGLPHVTMYTLDTNGSPFARVYFGNKDEAAQERKLEPGFVGEVGLPAVDESFWEMKVENLEKAPAVVIIRPSRYSGDPQTSGSVGSPHGRIIAYNIDFTSLLSHAFSFSRQRMILPASVPQGRFDLMLTLRDHPTEALQKAIQRQFGFTAKRETREIDVLWLKVKDPTLLALHASESGSKMDFKQDNGMWAYIGFPISQVAEFFLEGMAFDKPVLLEPGLAGKFDLTFQEDAEDMQQAVSNELAQAGLELVPRREPIEMLVVEQAN